METQNIIMLLFGAVQAGVLWWMKETWSTQKAFAIELRDVRHDYDAKVTALSTIVNDFKVSVAKEYAAKDDIKEIKELLQQLSRDLNTKADKP